MKPHISLNVPANITAISEVSLGNIGSGPKPAQPENNYFVFGNLEPLLRMTGGNVCLFYVGMLGRINNKSCVDWSVLLDQINWVWTLYL